MRFFAFLPTFFLFLLTSCQPPTEANGKAETAQETRDTGPETIPAAPNDEDGDGVFSGEDCDDADATAYPGATEVCDGVDNDCNGEIDEEPPVWYMDGDGDGFGDPLGTAKGCEQPYRYATNSNDCNDFNAAISPNATEVCNSTDDNCDGEIDNGVDENGGGIPFYADEDGDGRGGETFLIACPEDRPDGYRYFGDDCDDTNTDIRPGATEICDGIDNDCDAATDNNPIDGIAYYHDADGDGYGNAMEGGYRSCSQPPGMVADNTDCEERSADAYPGGTEVCDGFDNDCDGGVDEDTPLADVPTWYYDGDWDGYGDPTFWIQTCEVIFPFCVGSDPAGFLPLSTCSGNDRDDNDPNIH